MGLRHQPTNFITDPRKYKKKPAGDCNKTISYYEVVPSGMNFRNQSEKIQTSPDRECNKIICYSVEHRWVCNSRVFWGGNFCAISVRDFVFLQHPEAYSSMWCPRRDEIYRKSEKCSQQFTQTYISTKLPILQNAYN